MLTKEEIKNFALNQAMLRDAYKTEVKTMRQTYNEEYFRKKKARKQLAKEIKEKCFI